MYLEQLTYIVEVAKTKSISIASKNLHVSPSGISQSINQLENELGIKIFTRTKTATVPTDEGYKIIEKAEEAIIKLLEFKESARMHASLKNEELHITVVPNMSPIILKTIAAFKKDYPNVKIKIIEGLQQDVINATLEGSTDIGITSTRTTSEYLLSHAELINEKLLSSSLMVMVNKNSPLANKKELSPQDLLNHPVSWYYGANQFLHEFMEMYGPLDILITVNNLDMTRRSVAEGLTITFIPEISILDDPYISQGLVTVKPFVMHYPLVQTFWWIRSRKRKYSHVAKEFLNYLTFQISILNSRLHINPNNH
ncbi:LysR family transcriptional regulator [Neobacillus sp. NRS-1170]|uniref:LysR family transcriptional regulator n=1 Tax=Neobacillus sp. NRS-1170 TaxID=3233898 RepID=UPI003D2806E4